MELLNVPIAHHKTEGPCKTLTFLGIELDTVYMTARLPPEKLVKYICFIGKSIRCTLNELQSLIGMLQFSTSVIPVGKCFLRRLHNATIGMKTPYYLIKITDCMREDLMLWKHFLENYNGTTFIHYKPKITSYEVNMYSDSSKKGYGATLDKEYLCGTFPDIWLQESIEFLKLYPIFLLVEIF